MGLTWASAGYTVFIPDYIGFGLTLGKDHPYLYYPEMFISNDFTVVASSGLAGPYNFKRFAESFLERKNEEIDALPIFS